MSMKDQLWWKCSRPSPPCGERADVFPIVKLPCPCGSCNTILAAIIIPLPICGPCSTVVTAPEVINDVNLAFVRGAMVSRFPGRRLPVREDFRIEMQYLEHFVQGPGCDALPEKNWRPKT